MLVEGQLPFGIENLEINQFESGSLFGTFHSEQVMWRSEQTSNNPLL